jgi:hypothetical protein
VLREHVCDGRDVLRRRHVCLREHLRLRAMLSECQRVRNDLLRVGDGVRRGGLLSNWSSLWQHVLSYEHGLPERLDRSLWMPSGRTDLRSLLLREGSDVLRRFGGVLLSQGSDAVREVLLCVGSRLHGPGQGHLRLSPRHNPLRQRRQPHLLSGWDRLSFGMPSAVEQHSGRGLSRHPLRPGCEARLRPRCLGARLNVQRPSSW